MGGSVTTVVVGAGHAGLAASHFLRERGVDHVVLERGLVANSWRTERWDSLRLLTPNWLSRLPGQDYDGDDPDGYMTMAEVVAFIERFAAGAPVRTGVNVTSVRRTGEGFAVGDLRCRSVVIASGACNVPVVPGFGDLGVHQVTPFDYHNPDKLPDGGVLVVGASATGVQLAAELRASGRHVVLSVGEHTRMPRRHRGRDVLWWMHETGLWAQRYDEVDDLDRARRLPSPQLAGGADVDLNTLTGAGVELVGRLAAVRDGVALFSGGLRNVCSLADLKANRMLAGFDEWAGLADRVVLPPTRVPEKPRLRIDLGSGEISTIVWATGFRPDYSWLDLPVLDDKGRLRHDGGVTGIPGLYALGLPVLRRRRSTFLHGIEDDARYVVDHLIRTLRGTFDQSVSEAR
ncbi:NAD(P)-binding domain-containing protein [Actinoplanes sp. NPDC026670]|uniref:NAD(P)-binding domain-containing protein n=1 Tax=Actinoplanes sp. NPDC026670 TaxID=3154700 RepID=UPI0033E48A73